MGFLRLVVERRALLQQRRQTRRRQRPLLLEPGSCSASVIRVAAVAVGHGEHRVRPRPPRRAAASGPGRPRRGHSKLAERGIVEPLQDQTWQRDSSAALSSNTGSRSWRRPGHGAVLDIRQEAVLLGAVEAVDLIDEQEGALAVAPALRGLEDLAQVGDAGEHRRQGSKCRSVCSASRRAIVVLPQPGGPQGIADRLARRPACGRAGPRGPEGDPGRKCRPATWAAGVRRAASGRAGERARLATVSGTGR